MGMLQQRGKISSWKDERGFTLPEVMITIVIMGILLAIASSVWFGTVERRAVDSAANQLASDMRFANTSATNQLTSWQVVLTSGSSSYQLVKLTPTPETTSRSLPDNTKASTSITVKFNPNGSAEVTSGSGNTVVVSATDNNPQRTIEFNIATSRVQILN